jgi:hypothetical protein
VDEAHVEHPVRFVENEHLDGRQVDELLLDQVQQASRCGDQHGWRRAKGAHLFVLVHAAEDDRVGKAEMPPVRRDALVYLRSKLARRRQDERPDLPVASRRREALEDREHEGCRLAGTGLGTAEKVSAFEYDRNGLLLNGRGAFVPLRSERATKRLDELELGE